MTWVEARLSDFDRRRVALLDVLATLPPDRLERRPADGGWSIIEVVDHLVQVEVDVLGDLERIGERTPRRRWRERVGRWIVLAVLRLRIPVQVPSPGMRPVSGRSLAELRREWDARHAALRRFVAEPGPDLPLFRHPIAGRPTTAEAVQLMDVHFGRHQGQIRALL